jgi:hypothetical protein
MRAHGGRLRPLSMGRALVAPGTHTRAGRRSGRRHGVGRGSVVRPSTGDQPQATWRDTFLLPASASPALPPAGTRTWMPPSPCAPAIYSPTLVFAGPCPQPICCRASDPRHTLPTISAQQPGRSFAQDHMTALLSSAPLVLLIRAWWPPRRRRRHVLVDSSKQGA